MRIYFSGIGGVGIGPLAMIAQDAGYKVLGSDLHQSLTTQELAKRQISFSLDQSGENLKREHAQQPIDWLIHTASLPADHPELVAARQLGIKIGKRDELLAEIIRTKQLKLIAIAGTHGKTTTTGMVVWTLKQLGVPVSYSIGSTISFGPSGFYDPASQFFVYECDEFDRNFLHFEPWRAIITSVDYDHPDTYPSQQDYNQAFAQFINQSEHCVIYDQDLKNIPVTNCTTLRVIDKQTTLPQINQLKLAGQHNRENAYLVLTELSEEGFEAPQIQTALESFPGTSRRFEKLADNLYSDYGHHPVEIAATLQMARELSDQVVLVYQPHQNIRQHQIRDQYTDCMRLAETIYWLPTYLSREDPNLAILTPQELTTKLTNLSVVHYAEFDDQLWQEIQAARAAGKLVLCMGAGAIDEFIRQQLAISLK